jgi:hypothetical protein
MNGQKGKGKEKEEGKAPPNCVDGIPRSGSEQYPRVHITMIIHRVRNSDRLAHGNFIQL